MDSYIESSFHFSLNDNTISLLNWKLCSLFQNLSSKSICTVSSPNRPNQYSFSLSLSSLIMALVSHHVYLFLDRVGTAPAIFTYLCLFSADHSFQIHFPRSFLFAIPFTIILCLMRAEWAHAAQEYNVQSNSCTICLLAYWKNLPLSRDKVRLFGIWFKYLNPTTLSRVDY